MVLAILLSVLGAAAAIFMATLFWRARRARVGPLPEAIGFSAVLTFFDALGIGNYAPTAAYLKFRKLTADELIPATLLVGYAMGTATEALAFITSVQVDPALLGASILASVVGAFIGVSLTAGLPARPVRLALGAGLLVAAIIMALSNLGLMPRGGSLTALPPGAFVLVVAVSFILGVLINLGIGNYAPTLVLVSLLGMDPHAAFPIMMGSAALLMVTSGTKLLKTRPLDLRLILGMGIGGPPAVLVAAFIVKSLPIDQLRWGVVAVVTYAAITMLHAAFRPPVAPPAVRSADGETGSTLARDH
jgi:uncharacterized membrane protein YfcA